MTTTRRSRTGALVIALLLISAATIGFAPPAQASCLGPDGRSTWPGDEKFIGVALPGPTTPDGALLAPARFWVFRWIEGDGGRVEQVETSYSAIPEGGYVEISVGIKPKAGEVWFVELRNGSPACTRSRSLIPDRPAMP